MLLAIKLAWVSHWSHGIHCCLGLKCLLTHLCEEKLGILFRSNNYYNMLTLSSKNSQISSFCLRQGCKRSLKEVQGGHATETSYIRLIRLIPHWRNMTECPRWLILLIHSISFPFPIFPIRFPTIFLILRFPIPGQGWFSSSHAAVRRREVSRGEGNPPKKGQHAWWI